jgi:hypothetical protein
MLALIFLEIWHSQISKKISASIQKFFSAAKGGVILQIGKFVMHSI